MAAGEQPQPKDLKALKEIINGKPADALVIRRLVTCKLIEDLDGTALLTQSGLRAAMRFSDSD